MIELELPPRRWFMDVSPLRVSSAYRRFWVSGVASGVGSQLTAVAIGIQIYHLSGSTAAVALIGGFALGPMVVMGILGDTIVDSFDRRRVLITVSSVSLLAPLGIAALAWNGVRLLWPYYVFTTLSSTCSGLVGASRFAIHPRLVPREQLPAVAALSGVSAGLQSAGGPALAGLLVTTAGYQWTYTTDCMLFIIGFWGIVSLPPDPPSRREQTGSRRAGGRITVPAFGYQPARGHRVEHCLVCVWQKLCHSPRRGCPRHWGGPATVGLLAASGAIGVVLSGLTSAPLGRVHAHGKAMAIFTAGFGLMVVFIGVTILVLTSADRGTRPNQLNLAALLTLCALLALAGAADNLADIFRTTMMQSATPDALRGRLQGLFTLVLSGGPRLGDVYAGFLAAATALWFPALLGGAVILLVAISVLRLNHDFRHYDARRPLP